MSKPYLCAKCKDELEVTESDDGTAILIKDHYCDGRKADFNRRMRRITTFIDNNILVTTSEISAYIGVEDRQIYRHLEALLDDNTIQREKRGRIYYYYSNNEGKAILSRVKRPKVVKLMS